MLKLAAAGLLAMSGMAAHAQAPARDLPRQLKTGERDDWRAIFAAMRGGAWDEAARRLDSAERGPLHDIARAELYTAKGSPKVDLPPLEALLARAPHLPQAAQLQRMAATRGAIDLPSVAEPHRLSWLGGKPLRARADSVKGDPAGSVLAAKIQPLIKDNRPAEAEALIDEAEATLSLEALTEQRQRVAWSYYITGDDAAARLLAAKARTGYGEWAVHAEWVIGLAAWKQKDCRAAQSAFETVAARGEDAEFRAAGHYWASRADLMCGEPNKVQARLRAAAASDETFYGLLATRALGMKRRHVDLPDSDRIADAPNVRAAIALAEIGEYRLADEAVRHQAKIGNPGDHEALVALAARLQLPEAQLWLAHNGPRGVRLKTPARYPAPNWTPDGGWRVDRSLVFAHALQESNFRRDVVSPAGAYGLMQIMPAAAEDISRRKGTGWSRDSLTAPSTNMEFGQSHLEYLRDFHATEGKLPKVIAAYNAGPRPVAEWNARGLDQGDPLLWMESIPYWETRGYVQIVLRNYWMYQRHAGEASPSLAALAQGQWPRFPGAVHDTRTVGRSRAGK